MMAVACDHLGAFVVDAGARPPIVKVTTQKSGWMGVLCVITDLILATLQYSSRRPARPCPSPDSMEQVMEESEQGAPDIRGTAANKEPLTSQSN